MKTLADFKRKLKVGSQVQTIRHTKIGNQDLGIRPVSIVQSNMFALATTRTTGETVDSWCEFPKSADLKIIDENTVSICWQGEPRLTYKFL